MSTILKPPETAPRSAAAGLRPPRWFDRLCLSCAAGVLAVGVAALALGALGLLHAVTVIPLSVLMFVLSVPVLRSLDTWRGTTDPAADPPAATPASGSPATVQLAAALAVLVCVGAGIWASVVPGTPVLVDRDPASYATTAKWLAEGNSLWVQQPLAAFGDNSSIQAGSTGVFEVGDRLEFQFLHLPAAVAAAAATIAGDWAVFVTGGLVAALGLLALYAVAVRLTGRPLLALAAPCAIAVSMPFVVVARDTFSESYSLLFLWTALLLLCDLAEQRAGQLDGPGGVRLAAAAGLFAGATVLARVDSVLFIVVLAVVATLWVVAARDGERSARRAAVRAASIAAGVMVVVALVDLVAASSTYMRILDSRLWMLLALLALTGIGCAVAIGNAPWIRERVTRLSSLRTSTAWVLSATVALWLLGLWFMRPALSAAPEDPAVPGATDPWAFEWMQWYLGMPTVALAVGAMVVATYRFVVGRLAAALVPLVALVAGTGALYWWSANIRPDHVWATRRFLPVVLPGLVVLACVAVAWVVQRVDSARVRSAVALVAGAVIVVPPLLVTLPAPLMARQRAVVDVVEEACALLGDDAAVLVVGGIDRLVLPQALRSWCGVPVATPVETDGLLDRSELQALAAEVSARGRQLHVVGSDPEAVAEVLPVGATATLTEEIISTRRLEVAFERVPRRYMTDDERLLLGGPYSLGVAAVPAADSDGGG